MSASRPELIEILRRVRTVPWNGSGYAMTANHVRRQLEIDLCPLLELLDPLELNNPIYLAKLSRFLLYLSAINKYQSQGVAAQHLNITQQELIDFMFATSKQMFGTRYATFPNHRTRQATTFPRPDWTVLLLDLENKTVDTGAVTEDLDYLEQCEEEGQNVCGNLYTYEYEHLPKDAKYFELETQLQHCLNTRKRIYKRYNLI